MHSKRPELHLNDYNVNIISYSTSFIADETDGIGAMGDIGGPLTLYQTVAGELVQTSFPKHAPVEGGEFALKVRFFVDAVKEGKPAPVTTDQIIINQAIIDGIIRSNKLGREVTIEISDI